MELLKAVEKSNRLKNDIVKLDQWFNEMKLKSKPINGQSWIKVERAIDDAISELQSELNVMEARIKKAATGIEVDM